MEGPFDGFVVETRTKDPKRRGMFVLAVENCTLEGGLELGNGKLGDVIGDFVCVLGPELVAKVSDGRLWHGGKPISFCPCPESKSHLIVKFLLRREHLVGQRAFCNDCEVRWKERMKQGP